MPISEQIYPLAVKIKKYLHDFNIFESVPPSNDYYVVQGQRISTRLFVVLLLLSLFILIFYNSLIIVKKTIIVPQPTYEQYSHLYLAYSDQLQCPCKQVSIQYKQVVHLNYTLHYACTSFLISEEWIQYLIHTRYPNAFYTDDFRSVSRFAFQALRALCKLSDRMIRHSLEDFYLTEYVSTTLKTTDVLASESEAQISHFKFSTKDRFSSSLKMIRETTRANSLFSGLFTSHSLYIWNPQEDVTVFIRTYSGYSCDETTSYFTSAVFYHVNTDAIVFRVPGFYVGCYIIESVFHSTLECFHDEECFNQVKYYVNSSLTLNTGVLKAPLSSNFTGNTSIEEIVNALMVEKWDSYIGFEKYYDECQPTQCSYTVESRNGLVYIVTIVMGLVGGLVTIILKFIVPKIVNYVRFKKNPTRVRAGKFVSIVKQVKR